MDWMDWMDGWLSYTAVTPRASLQSDANNPRRKDVTSVNRHMPEESLTNVTSVTVTQLGTTACGVYSAREYLGVPSFA